MRKKVNGKNSSLLRLVLYFFSIIFTIVYIIYRIVFTVPSSGLINIIFGILVLFLEIFEGVRFFIYYFNVLRFDKTSPITPKIKNSKYPDVDVFIATINEKEELLRKTIDACLKMKYPQKDKVHVYLCDDGNRDSMRALANEFGIGYITRDNNCGAKAGNYNNALSVTSSPLIATFDADMCPTPYFLLKTVPFFVKNDNIGFVQLPQSFINPDIFQLRFKLYDSLPFEQDYFYHRIQCAKNNINTSIYCGTNALLSRAAIDSIDGFAVDTVTEDIATGMLIEAKGFRGIAINDVCAYGVATNDIDEFVKQRTRWSRGCIQVLKNYNVFKANGFSFRQKLDYFFSICYWFYGLKRIIYLCLPLLFSLFGIIVIDCDLSFFIFIFSIQYLFKRFVIDFLESNEKSSTWNNIYELVIAPFIMVAVLKELFGFENKKFEVTSKDNCSGKMSMLNKKLLFIHLSFLFISLVGFVLSIYKSSILGFQAYMLSMVWLLVNIFYLIIVLIFDLGYKSLNCCNFSSNKVKKYSVYSLISIFVNFFKKG